MLKVLTAAGSIATQGDDLRNRSFPRGLQRRRSFETAS
jgi:hypothetical protein